MIQWVMDDRLAYGDKAECNPSSPRAAVVHACKAPCFLTVRPGSKGPPLPGHAATSHEDGLNLYLNMIDPDRPLFRLAMFEHFMDFVDRHIQHRPVIVHCRAGLSRSPSLVLLWLAKRTDVIPGTSYLEAAEAFLSHFRYAPRAGIAIWLRDNWHRIAAVDQPR